LLTTDQALATEAAMARPEYDPNRNCLESHERDILDSGRELLSMFASESEIRDWAARHKITGDPFAAYHRAVDAQKPARRPGARTGIR
jgi:hypothetical protein